MIIKDKNKINAVFTMKIIHMYKTVLVFSFKIYSNEFYSIIKILNTTFLSFTTLKSKIAL